jgi:hypothetical protein
MRRLIQDLLSSVDPVHFPPEKILQAGVVDSGLMPLPELPFIIHRYSIGRRGGRQGSAMPGLDVWIYDVPGSYANLIDPTLVAVRNTLLAVSDLRGHGEHIAAIDWANDSADLPAEEFQGITRMSSFNLVGSTA